MKAENMTATISDKRKSNVREFLPVIDLSDARTNDASARLKLARKFDHAFSNSGFCYVSNHGIAQQVIDETFAITDRFFQEPLEKKIKLLPSAANLFRGYVSETRKVRSYYDFNSGAPASDNVRESVGGKENFTFGEDDDGRAYDPKVTEKRAMQTPWPEDLPEFHEKSYRFFTEMQKVGQDILSLIALALDADENFFRERFGKERNTSLCNLSSYPTLTVAEAAAGKQSLLAHADYSCITLLMQDAVGGLEVEERASQEWIGATPIPGTLVINVGDMLARWSNNRYVSTRHRVTNRAGQKRCSMVVFCNPRADVTVDPRNLGVSDKESLYPPIQVGQYMTDRAVEAYGTDEDLAHAKSQRDSAT